MGKDKGKGIVGQLPSAFSLVSLSIGFTEHRDQGYEAEDQQNEISTTQNLL